MPVSKPRGKSGNLTPWFYVVINIEGIEIITDKLRLTLLPESYQFSVTFVVRDSLILSFMLRCKNGLKSINVLLFLFIPVVSQFLLRKFFFISVIFCTKMCEVCQKLFRRINFWVKRGSEERWQ